MKLTVEKQTLAAGLAKVSGTIQSKNTIPILANISYVADDNGLTLRATDLDIEVSTTIEATVTENGQGTVDADMLSNIVKKLPAGRLIEMHDDKDRLHVTSGKSVFDFATLPIDQYPEIATSEYGVTFDMAADDLLRMMNKTAFAMSSEETRFMLCGVYFHPDEGNIIAVSTNGQRLAKAWIEHDAQFPGVIIPAKTVGELRKILGIGVVSVSVSETKVRFDMGDTVIVSKVVDGAFPDYTRVIPKGLPDTFRVDAKAFSQSAALVSTVSDNKLRSVSVNVLDGAVALSVKGGMHLAEDEVEAIVTGGESVMHYNSKYLADALAQADGGDVDFHYKSDDPMQPAMICPTEDDRFVAVIMPTRG